MQLTLARSALGPIANDKAAVLDNVNVSEHFARHRHSRSAPCQAQHARVRKPHQGAVSVKLTIAHYNYSEGPGLRRSTKSAGQVRVGLMVG